MKYINFNRVKIKNFLSVGEDIVQVDFRTGLNIITGVNKDKEDRRNGVGKSTIADAIYFAIYGSTLRELKKEHVTNNVTQGTASVELDFTISDNGQSDEYKIIRTLDPSKCYLYINDVDKTLDSISNTTKEVVKIINSSPEVFQNCVIMTVNNTVPFMAKKKIEKRKFIEGIFNLQIFSDMLQYIRGEYNEVIKSFDIECAKFEEVSNSLESYFKQKETHDKDIQSRRERLQYRKKCNIESIEELQGTSLDDNIDSKIEKTESRLKELKDAKKLVRGKIDTFNTSLGEVTSSIKFTKSNLKKIDASGDTCPVCLQAIDDVHRDHIQEEKVKLSQSLQELEEQQLNMSSKLTKASDTLNVVTTSERKHTAKLQQYFLDKQEYKNTKDRIENLVKLNKEIEEDISSLSTSNTGVDELILKTEERLAIAQKEIDKIKVNVNKLDIAKFVVSEEGVKSYIVKKILQLFNSKLAYYLKKMDANCVCVFNEYFEEEIIDEKGKICSYFNFSGAERKNIDLACLFAFMDIRRLQGDVAFNFSVYDELFDSSLDERGVELVIEILKERVEKYKECIMVISHRKESAKIAQGEVIYLEKKGGITTRIDFNSN